MDTSWITPPLVIALLALWVAYFNFSRANYAVVRVRDCRTSYAQDIRENGGLGFSHFRIILQNLGIPLNNVSMALSYRGKDGSGLFTVPLMSKGTATVREGQFAKGMITDFSLKTHQMDGDSALWLAELEDPRRQAASLCLYADGFLVWEYRLDGAGVWFKSRWNRLAVRLNHLLKRRMGTTREGVPIVKYYSLLPAFVLPALAVARFGESLRRERRAVDSPVPV